MIWPMVKFSEVTEKLYVKDRYPALDSRNSTCARLCDHNVSN